MKLMLKDNRKHDSSLRIENNKAIILRNVWLDGDLYQASVCCIYSCFMEQMEEVVEFGSEDPGVGLDSACFIY